MQTIKTVQRSPCAISLTHTFVKFHRILYLHMKKKAVSLQMGLVLEIYGNTCMFYIVNDNKHLLQI